MKIAIQGVKASFHDVVARNYFRDHAITRVECLSFGVLANALKEGRADAAVMAIENTIAGSILPNYHLLESFGFKIAGEAYLRIELSLLALPGQKLEELKLVQSHPMALLQCTEFLSTLPGIKILEASDTAESAKLISENRLSHHAAIASAQCGDEYGLEVLRKGIESNKLNYTRFLVIRRSEDYEAPKDANKSSLRFEAAHRPGSLAEVLQILSKHSVNMTKLQSVPILGKPYQYSFHVDLEWEDAGRYREALRLLDQATSELIHFGDYRTGEKPFL